MERGWRIVGVTMATQAAQAGMLIYLFGAIAATLKDALGVPLAQVMIGTTCLSLVMSALAPLAGRLVDQVPIRRLMLVGCAALAAGSASLARVDAVWQMWLIFTLLMPVANLLLGQMTSAALVARWFRDGRGKALGVSTLGTSLGGFVYPLAFAGLSEAVGWRMSIAALGIGTAIIVATLVMRFAAEPPAPPPAPDASPAAPPPGLGAILKVPAFWMIGIAVGVKIAVYLAIVKNIPVLAQSLGVEGVGAAGFVSLLAISSMGGKLVFGWLADRLALKTVFILALAMTALGFGLLLAAVGYWSLFLACAALGVSAGGVLPVWAAMVGHYFAPASFGRALGLMNLIMVPMTASAAPFAAWTFDRTGSYHIAILCFIGALVVAIGLVLPLSRGGARS